jgi:dihydrolipoyl dehydrogenase
MSRQAEALVIGAGPGGYVAAIRLAQLGKKTILIDRDKLGGECLNYGCIPSKALIHAANLFENISKSDSIGISVAGAKVNVEKLQEWKSGVVAKLRNGIATLCKGNNIEVIFGEASFESANSVSVKTAEGITAVQSDNIIIATGSKPIELPALKFDGKRIISSKEALELSRIPEQLIIVGGGAIGLEIGILYAKFGSKLTVIELTEQLLPGTDADLVQIVSRTLRRLGAKVLLKSKVVGYEEAGEGIKILVETPNGQESHEADLVLVSVGRRPRIDGLIIEKAGVEVTEKGFIKVDKKLHTSTPSVYAIGDVVGPPFLAHKASREGIVAAEVIAGQNSELDYRALPSAVFTSPEVATVGLSEAQLEKEGRAIHIGKFPLAALGRALTNDDIDGFVKVIADAETDEVLGIEVVGGGASDLISEAAFAIEMGATSEDLALTIHPHPTLPEGIMEAAEAVKGRAIHILRR